MNHHHKHMDKKTIIRRIGFVIGGIAIAGLFAFLFGFFVMVLWNWLMPAIFGLTKISYWQAWGLVVLSHLLFKGPHHPNKNRQNHEDPYGWKEKFHKKFKNICCDKPENQSEETPQI